MAARLTAFFLLALLLLPFSGPAAEPNGSTDKAEKEIAAAARAGKFADVLVLLVQLRRASPERYEDGRFDYLSARALAATAHASAALPLFERYIASDDLFDVPARLAAAGLKFDRSDGLGALELLFPLLQRKGGAVSRRALRIALDALETKLDAAVLQKLVAAHPPAAPRERRRLMALRAEALDESGSGPEAAALREEILREARRDDAAAVVLAREMRGAAPGKMSDRLLSLLIDTARAQRDLELAETLAAERDRRAFLETPDRRGIDQALERWGSRFDLARLRASRGKFAEAAEGFASILATKPARTKRPKSRKDDTPGTAAFFSRVRFNLGAVLEKLGRLDDAVKEFQRVEAERVGPANLATLQRARLEMRRGDLALAESLLDRPSVLRDAGRIEGLLLLVERRAETGDARGGMRTFAKIETLARVRRLPEPWKGELPFWRGRVAEAGGNVTGALEGYTRVLAERPYSAAGEMAKERLLGLDAAARTAFLRELRIRGESLLARGDARGAKQKLLPPALLGDAAARDLLKLAYQRLPLYSDVLLAPDLSDDALPTLCGDAGACRLIQLGLPVEAEPIVRDASRLDSLLGCVVAARLAEGADAGPAALDAAEALDRKIPDDFLLELAPRSIVRALAPRPFDRLVAETAADSGVPHGLLYAVMRQESRFDREAASPAAARGLMQLTLPAAGDAARELHEEPPAYADLYDPARSLRLGAHTLKTLLARFNGNAALAISGYNAGAGQTSLWAGGAKAPAEALLAAISYPETRAYFRRVLAHQILYRQSEKKPELSAAPAAPPATPTSGK